MRVIGGKSKGKKLKFPKLSKDQKLRPLTDQAREALFNILVRKIQGCVFLDLFAGTGAVGIEALSRGASVSFFVEINKKAVSVIRDNLEITGFTDQAEVYSLDVLRAIKLFDSKNAVFDVIFIGAPYNSPVLEETLKALSVSSVIGKDGIVVAEHRSNHKLADSYDGLHVLRQTRYGDTFLSFYKMKDENMSGQNISEDKK